MKKLFCFILSFVLALGVCPVAFAEVGLPLGVTEEMCHSDFWKSCSISDANQVLMTPEDIRAYNKDAVDGSGTYVVGIENIKPTYKADYQRQIMKFDVPTRNLFVDGVKIDNAAYYGKINDAILNTGYRETEKETEYLIAVRPTLMRYMPTVDTIGYTADDPDDEMAYACIQVNEPFAVRQMCVIDGIKFYYGYTIDCVGWVPAEDFAVCSGREEWLDAWYCDVESKDFIVITQDKLTLELSLRDKDLSGLKLTLGTTLKLIEKENIPATIDGRNTWNNYAVYIPAKDADGNYVKKPALISQHYSVSVGYLPFTQANVLDVAFACLGNRYGWGGMLDSYDCSLYTRTVYRCFGLTHPRNAGWQQNVPGHRIDLSAMTDEEKQSVIETLPIGASLHFPGHTMLYVGTVNGVSYAISALGTAVESEGATDVLNVYNVSLTPLTLRRGKSYGYTTWLQNLNAVMMVMPKFDLNNGTVEAVENCDGSERTITVKVGEYTLLENVHYSVTDDGDTIVLTGKNNFNGQVTVTPTKLHKDADYNGFCDFCKINISGKKFPQIIKFFNKIFAWILNHFFIMR